MRKGVRTGAWLVLLAGGEPASAGAVSGMQVADFTAHWTGYVALALFALGYLLVVAEEFLHLRKSKPMMVVAGVLWGLVALAYQQSDLPAAGSIPAAAFRHNLLEFAELFLFLLAAMTFINVMEERRLFEALRAWLVGRRLTYRGIFWVTGTLAFFVSPVADNLTTALLMGAVVTAMGGRNSRFIVPSCVNIVIAANAGGVFSPFGDITTLMVWQKGRVAFLEFFAIFVPAVINWLVPAVLMAFSVPKDSPPPARESVSIRPGGWTVAGLFLFTIALAVYLHNALGLPPVLGMMTGLGLLNIHGYFLRRFELRKLDVAAEGPLDHLELLGERRPFDIFSIMARAEWDTLMFFYGVILAVGALGTLGYLSLTSGLLYTGLGPTWANILVGLLSAIVDNIPVMFAVLSMDPPMSQGQWLLVTLTAGVGGSLLSVGSAAGVALMGQARGSYTFLGHLRWTPAIALGYVASIFCHLWLNSSLF